MRRQFSRAARSRRRAPRKEVFEERYSRLEIHRAIMRCARWYGYWPREAEYLAWAEAMREMHQLSAAKHVLRIPSSKPIYKRFGGYRVALAATRDRKSVV